MADKGVLDYLEPIETKTRGVAVLDALAEMIERAELEIGDRIPPEISLAQHLGVGRSTIREALNRWEGLGIIKRRRGAGTYLTARVQTSQGLVPTMIRLEGEALLQLLEVRRALEHDAVHKAAIDATDGQRRRIAALHDELMSLVNGRKPWRKADAAFHGAVYDASGNPLFGQILFKLDQALERSAESPFGRTDFGLKSFPMHQQLCDGVVKGDTKMARDAINAILDTVEAEIRIIISSPRK
ncbi:MAG: FadR family transcriptional regulator [Alphaproteobacteria bacterium]|nr:FadR family transcriptional regulator [Alphaproteobacteria bacterium]